MKDRLTDSVNNPNPDLEPDDNMDSPVKEDSPTLSLPDKRSTDQYVNSAALQMPPVGHLALYINGEKLPIHIPQEEKVILGRGQTNIKGSALDLSIYYAHLLGVSREHVAVGFSANQWKLEDLNSTNGTWVNEEKLSPYEPYVLHNGDIIWLGHMMMLVRFQE